jgi:hypothetical protein
MKTITLLFAAILCFAQETPTAPTQQKYYKFDFVVKELDAGKVQGSKNYSVIGGVRGRENSMMIRTGDKVQVPTGGTASATQYTYVDIGTNIDCRIVYESATELGLSISADISSADTPRAQVISQIKWNSNVLVPLRKATVIFTSDSITKKTQTQLEVTATPLP